MKIAFLKVLTGIYHQRVEYPIEKLVDEGLRK
jgi:membrane-associated HD superfamily phosphohydrolase